MTANPAFRYPNLVVGTKVKVVKSITQDATYVGQEGEVRASHRVPHLPVEVHIPSLGYSSMFAEEELEVIR